MENSFSDVVLGSSRIFLNRVLRSYLFGSLFSDQWTIRDINVMYISEKFEGYPDPRNLNFWTYFQGIFLGYWEPSEKIMYPRNIREITYIREPSEKIFRYIFTHPRNMPSEIQLSLLFKLCLSTEFLVSKIDLRYFLWSRLFRSETGQNFIRDQHSVKCLSYFTIFY